MKIYDFTVKNRKGEDISLENYKGINLVIKHQKVMKKSILFAN